MKKGFFDRRIPTVFALFLLLGGIAVTMLLINQGVFTVTQASPEVEPRNVTVTNISDSSFTVAFTTLQETVAAVSITIDGEEKLLFDDRDTDTRNAYYSHMITVKNLKPNSNYGYKILSNGTTYPEDDTLFQAVTSGKISDTPEETSMQGKVILPSGEAGSDTLVLVTPTDGAVASIVTDQNGEYVIPARLLKSADGSAYLDISDPIPLSIRALQGENESTIETQFVPNSIIPPISLSQNYEFIASLEEELTATPSSLFEEPDPQISNSLSIRTPREDEILVDTRPQIRGTAPAGGIVRVLIDGKNAAQLRASPNGNWSFRPSTPLTAGEHTTSVVSGGRTVTQNFSVFSSGSQIAQTATPSASISPTRTATPAVTAPPSPTGILALSPTITTPISPTVTAIPSPTGITVTSIPIGAPSAAVSPTIQPTTFVPTKIPLPPAGNESYSILLTGVAVLFIVTGSILFFIL